MKLKISSIPQIYRNIKRWSEILAVLSKYGLADWLSRLNIEFVKDQIKDSQGEALARHSQEKRIRLALTALGPTFIKLGQLLSTRPDLVGIALADELSLLQSNVPADSPEVVRELVETELGQPIEELFAEFDDVPIASASIGQVHKAKLHSGQPVVVKVQHAGIEQTVHQDLDVLAGVAQLAERIPEFAVYRPAASVGEMGRTLRRELDFGREERNLQQFNSLFEREDCIHIPQPISELCTPRVLTMELMEGLLLKDREAIVSAGINLDEVARRGAKLYLEMIFTHGFYHADPHPGNILLLPDDVIGLLDFGMVGRLDERLREDIEDMLMAIVDRDVSLLTTLIIRVGSIPPDLDEGALANDVADFVGLYATQSLADFNLSGALRDMTEMIRRFHIMLPPQMGMLIKTLVTLEGTTKMLTPQFSLMEVMQPFHRRLLLQRLSPRRHLRKLRRFYIEVEQLVEVLPRRITDILDQVQSGRFDVHLDHRRLGPSVNRLVFGILTSALFLGSSVMLSMKVPPLINIPPAFLGLQDISLLGLTGCLVSMMTAFRLLWAIAKSGNLDQQD